MPGDEFRTFMFSTFEDCFIPFKVGKTYSLMNIKKNGVPFFSPVWFGSKVGVSYINPQNTVIQLCFHSMADYSDGTGFAVTNNDLTEYNVNVNGFNTSVSENYQYPEISKFFTEYGGTINSSETIYFGIWSYP